MRRTNISDGGMPAAVGREKGQWEQSPNLKEKEKPQ